MNIKFNGEYGAPNGSFCYNVQEYIVWNMLWGESITHDQGGACQA